MKITEILPQKRNNRVNIYIDGEFAFGLDEELRFKYDLYVGKEVSQDFIDEVIKAEEEKKVINQALNLLSYGARSRKELYKRLAKKGYEEEQIEKAIAFCEKYGYINDHEYAKSFIRDRIKLKKHGSRRIRYDLISKGIGQEVIDQVLDIDEDEEYERALELAKKRIKSYKNDNKQAIYRKLGGYLARRGYPYSVVTKVLREVLGELEG